MGQGRAGSNRLDPPKMVSGVLLPMWKDMQPPHHLQVTLLSNVEVAPSLHVLEFTPTKDEKVDFVPGQYVTFYLEHEGKRITRSYSFFSSASHHNRFRLLIKKVDGGFASTLLCELSPEGRPVLDALAPLGKFNLKPPDGRTVVMVATGTGLAPFVPMLEALWKSYPTTPTWLFFGNRTVEEVVDRRELTLLEQVWYNFHFVPIVSRPPSDDSWKGKVGHVQEHVRGSFPDLSNADVYLCGVKGMVNEMQDLSIQLGCPKDHVFVERY